MWMRATKVKPEKSSTQLVHKEFNYLSNKVQRYLALVIFYVFLNRTVSDIIETWIILFEVRYFILVFLPFSEVD
jgi:hypothetical protein